MISELAGQDTEVEDLRRELDRLHRYIRQEWARAQPAGGSAPSSAEADRRLLESTAMAARHVEEAQARADRIVAEAETRAAQRLAAADEMAERTLALAQQEVTRSRQTADEAAKAAVASIRQRYQDIIVRAHQRAEQAAANALHGLEQQAGDAADPGSARAQLQLRASYLASTAEVSRTAMRAALTYATREFDRLMGVPG